MGLLPTLPRGCSLQGLTAEDHPWGHCWGLGQPPPSRRHVLMLSLSGDTWESKRELLGVVLSLPCSLCLRRLRASPRCQCCSSRQRCTKERCPQEGKCHPVSALLLSPQQGALAVAATSSWWPFLYVLEQLWELQPCWGCGGCLVG